MDHDKVDAVIKVSAPASTMLLGEYAVLHRGHALVCAVDQRIYVELTPRSDNQIEIISSLGRYKTGSKQIEITPPFEFVLTTLKKFQKQLKQGVTLTIQSEFSDKVGLASSAAVTVATLFAITTWLKKSYSEIELIRQARSIVQQVQGMGSGADVAACVLGGIVCYRKQPLIAQKIQGDLSLNLIYSGNKTPTSVVVKQVEKQFASYPSLYHSLLNTIDSCVQQSVSAIKSEDNETLGRMMKLQQGLMQSLGVNTPLLQNIVDELLSIPTIIGAKISGSGLGDSIIALGTLSDNFVSRYADLGVKRMPMEIAAEGVRHEKI